MCKSESASTSTHYCFYQSIYNRCGWWISITSLLQIHNRKYGSTILGVSCLEVCPFRQIWAGWASECSEWISWNSHQSRHSTGTACFIMYIVCIVVCTLHSFTEKKENTTTPGTVAGYVSSRPITTLWNIMCIFVCNPALGLLYNKKVIWLDTLLECCIKSAMFCSGRKWLGWWSYV